LVDVDDVEAIVDRAASVRGGVSPELLASARATAERNSLERQDPLWETLFAGFVDRGTA
jgi:hypothetical protein